MKTYFRHKSLNVVDVKELIVLEYLDFEGKYRDYVEAHDFWELCYVESGKVCLETEEEKKQLSRGEIAIIPPDKTHSYYSENGNKSRVFVICFACSSQSLKLLGNISLSLDKEQEDLIKKIIAEYTDTFRINEDDLMEILPSASFGGQQSIILLLEYLLICLIRRLSLGKKPEIVFFKDDEFYEEIVGVITDFLHDNISRKITLNDVCKKVNYSSSFICKIFKAQTGETLFAYFNRLKAEEAKCLLTQTDMSVTDISSNLGFSDVKYFGAMFKYHTGMSPTKYRKNER